MAKKMLAVLIVLMLMCGCANAQSTKPLARQGFMLDTVISISLYDTQDEAILDGAFALCEEYEQLFSRTISTSDVYRINHSDGAPVEVSDATAELLCIALEYARLSGGAFDPTIEPLVTLWDIMADEPHVPDADAISAALARVDWTKVSVDGNVVTLHAGMGLDLGGVAPGLAFLEQESVSVDLGNTDRHRIGASVPHPFHVKVAAVGKIVPGRLSADPALVESEVFNHRPHRLPLRKSPRRQSPRLPE